MEDVMSKLCANKNIKEIVGRVNDITYKIIYHIYLADIKRFIDDFTNKINSTNFHILNEIYPGIFHRISFFSDEIITNVTSGNIIFEVENCLYNCICQKDIGRSIQDSLLEPNNIYGPRDGLVENIETNIALIQKRMKSTSIIQKDFNIGLRSNTLVSLLYIHDITNKNLINNIEKTLTNINIDTLYSVYDLINVLEKSKIFPTIGEVSSPDSVCTSLNEGRVVLLIDQIPIALVMPVDITFFLSLKESYSAKKSIVIYHKVLLTICIFFAIYFLGIYSSLVTYHNTNISLIAISEIKSSLKGSTLPIYMEFILIIFLFDLLRLASSKSPNINLQNVIITVGGLLIGQNAVNSGFISSFNLVVTAISYICGYAITNNQRFLNAISLLRMFLLVMGMFLGMFGVLLGIIVTTLLVSNIKSFNTLYLYPFSNFNKYSLKKFFMGKYSSKKRYRDENMQTIDNTKGE